MSAISSQDEIMAELIGRYGELLLNESNDFFADLASSIVGQQLSAKAAATIWNRVKAALGEVNPENVIKTSNETLRSAGLSSQKAEYIKSLATAAQNKTLELDRLRDLENEEIIRQLTAIKGVGRWTAEMFLIFGLARPDVFSFGDGGLFSAMNKLYGEMTKEKMTEISEKWSPYRSFACLYLWESLDNAPKQQADF